MPVNESSYGSSPSSDPMTVIAGVVTLSLILITLLLALTICLLPPRLWTLPRDRREAALGSAHSRLYQRHPPPPLLADHGVVGQLEKVAAAPVEEMAAPP